MGDIKLTVLERIVIPLFGSTVCGLLSGAICNALKFDKADVVGLAVTLVTFVISYKLLPDLPQAPQDGPMESSVRLTLVNEDSTEGQYLGLACSIEKLVELAESVQAGKPLTTRQLTGRHGIFSQSEWARVRHELVKAGLFRWVNGSYVNGGVELTARGRATFWGIANPRPTLPNGLHLASRSRTSDVHARTRAENDTIGGQNERR